MTRIARRSDVRNLNRRAGTKHPPKISVEKLREDRAAAFRLYLWADQHREDADHHVRVLGTIARYLEPVLEQIKTTLVMVQAQAQAVDWETRAAAQNVAATRDALLAELDERCTKAGAPALKDDPLCQLVDLEYEGLEGRARKARIPRSAEFANRVAKRAAWDRYTASEAKLQDDHRDRAVAAAKRGRP